MDTDSSDFKACVRAMSGSFALSSKALQSELAVSLYVFHTLFGPTIEARRELRQVYSDAGRPCLTPEDSSYQTVMRRVARSAALFTKVGQRKIARAVEGLTGSAAISAIVGLLTPLNLHTMDQVGVYVGHVEREHPVPAAAPSRNRRAADNPEVTHVKTRHIDVAVPPGTPAKELVTLANKLLRIAETMEVEA